MQKKLHIKKGDQVIVNTGEYKGQKGRVLEVDRDKNRAIVEGVNMVSKAYQTQCQKPPGRNYQAGSSCSYFQPEAGGSFIRGSHQDWKKAE